MFVASGTDTSAAPLVVPSCFARALGAADVAAVMALQDQAIGALTPAESHFLKRRNAEYLTRVLDGGLGVGLFTTDGNRLVAQALLRRQRFTQYEPNCNVNNYLLKLAERDPALAAKLLPELHSLGWSVIGTMLVSPEAAYQKKGLARQAIAALMQAYQAQGGKYLFASTAIENIASQKVFEAHEFVKLAEAVDPKDGWRCVILNHPPFW
jgi:hypothetical protein